VPKIVDHDLRRIAIVEATCDVIAAEGLEAATMRRIAQRTGSTTGLVTHYFDSKRDLLLAALRSVHRAAGRRMLAAVERGDRVHRSAVEAVIEEALPLDPGRLREWRVWLAFWAQASLDDELRREQHHRYDEWREMLEAVLRSDGRKVDVDVLIAVIDGVGTRAALDIDEFPPERQLAIVAEVLAGPDHAPGSADRA
jgi:AcrR family transcriptional regulator